MPVETKAHIEENSRRELGVKVTVEGTDREPEEGQGDHPQGHDRKERLVVA